MSAYMLWLNSSRERIKSENPGISITEISKKAGEMWRQLGKDEKEVKQENQECYSFVCICVESSFHLSYSFLSHVSLLLFFNSGVGNKGRRGQEAVRQSKERVQRERRRISI